MIEAGKCIFVFIIVLAIGSIYQFWARRLNRGIMPIRKKILLISIGAGIAFGTMVLIPAWIYRTQRGWDLTTVLGLGGGAFLLSALGLSILSWISLGLRQSRDP